MILVLLGTHELPFLRLAIQIEKLLINGTINDEVIVQLGNTKYESKYFKYFDFCTPLKMEMYYENADYILTHAGVGSITNGLRLNKKMIACPRLKEFGEHNDDHQLEIAKRFFKENYLLIYQPKDSLDRVFNKLKSFTPKPYVTNNKQIISDIQNYLDNY